MPEHLLGRGVLDRGGIAAEERSPGRRERDAADVRDRPSFQTLEHAAVLGIHREHHASRSARDPGQELARHHHRFLVRERDALPALERRDGGPQSDSAHHGVHDHVHAVFFSQRDERFLALQHLAPAERRPRPARRLGIHERDAARPQVLRRAHERGVVGACRQRDQEDQSSVRTMLTARGRAIPARRTCPNRRKCGSGTRRSNRTPRPRL